MRQHGLLPAAVFSTSLGLLGAGVTRAEPIHLEHLRAHAPKAEHNITALGTELLGDKSNLFTGSLEFEHTDARLPGNSALSVAVVRRHVAGRHIRIRGAFADWDLEVPRIGGTFPTTEGWINAQRSTARCTQYSAPPYVTRAGSAAPAMAPVAPATTPSFGGQAVNGAGSAGPGSAGGAVALGSNTLPSPTVFYAQEFWQGTHLHVPGQPGQEVLLRNPGDAAAPTDGNSYPLLTKEGWQIRCLPSVQNAAGEGFVALSPDGTTYRFDWLVSRFMPTVKGETANLGRSELMLVATLVTDRFGNTVSYTYSGSRLTRIDASDGRAITFTWNADNTVSSIADGTRSWYYSYAGTGNNTLSQVTLPDSSKWQFNLRPLVYYNPMELGEGAGCNYAGAWPDVTLTGTITHPSGATGSFDTRYVWHGRAGVTQYCINKSGLPGGATYAYWPKDSVSQTLARKTVTGPGMASLTWSFAYQGSVGSWAPCNGCAATKTVTVTDPQGHVSRHTFGTLWRVDEGQLLRIEHGYSPATATALRTTTQRYRGSGPWQEPAGTSVTDTTDYLAFRHRPLDQRVFTQDGTSFSWTVASSGGFDTRARPVQVTRQSSLGYSKTETTTYFDHSAKWVLGQVAGVTDSSGAVPEANTFDAVTANRSSSSSFGRLTDSYVWHPNGLLQQHRDAAGNATTLSNYVRGVAQLVNYADGSTESAVVNNLGLVTSLTNQAGTTTAFGYDAMGRLASVTHPNEPGLTYHPTTQVFQPVAGVEFGLGAGHWRQTITIGNARTVRYFDALWRERLVARWDTADPTGTSRVVETRYDLNGHRAFVSYPQRSIATVDFGTPGTAWARDALGRVISEFHDSELGLLQTQTAYLNGFQRRVTNPRGHATTFAYQAFDNPAEEAVAITNLWQPEGASLAIIRDRWGKPMTIARSGSFAGQNQSATRSYVYDAHQRLCKTIEPETGATVQPYDSANNIAWRASGLAFLSPTSCDQASVPATARVSYSYDVHRRLLNTSYGDGSPGVSRTYTRDGLLQSIASAGSTWTYSYNNRRLLTSESATGAGSTFTFPRSIDAYGNVSAQGYPDNSAVSYGPNAFGEPTQVSGYAAAVSRHPNGSIAGYTLGNGVTHSSTQNVRGMPLLWRDAGVVQDLYTWDANGNVVGIADQLEGLTSRAMGYDGLDRLTSASGIWGTGSFGYDSLGNLRASTVGSRTAVATVDATTNRLSSLNINGVSVAFGYDPNGNLSQRGTQGFVFDIGNRLNSATGKASYAYDGHGRRTWVAYADGSSKIQLYSQAGLLLWSQHSTQGNTRHIYLGKRLIAETNTLTGTSYTHTDALGSPVARTNSAGQITARTRYEPYGATAAGSNPTGIGFTGHVNDADTGLVYMQQRYYEPIAGRFLSVDPIVTNASDGSFFNRYVYAENNPYRFVDPDGRGPTLFEFPQQPGGPSGGGGLGGGGKASPAAGSSGALSRAGGATEAGGRAAKTEVHHVVAQTDKRAAEARDVMKSHGIDPKTEPTNKVPIPGDKHDITRRDSYVRDTNQRVAAQPNADAVKAECCKIADNLQKSTVDELSKRYPAK